MKIKLKTRKWLLHYHRNGCCHENFSGNWPFREDGVSAVQAFVSYESTGKILPTKCPQTMDRLLAGKKVHGINIDMYARDRADGFLSVKELKEICNELPKMFEEVERMKVKYWPIAS